MRRPHEIEGSRLVPRGEALLLVPILYLMAIAGLVVFGAHRYLLLALYLKHRRAEPAPDERFDPPLPRVTVQLPIYNERHVVERLIRAVGALDYPVELLEIQVLDDSTDDTPAIVAPVIDELRRSGVDIVHLRRANRVGFKAGALAEGARRASGDLLAIFDADFLPNRSFLRRAIGPFRDPEVGMVQARWGHLNRDYSALTRVAAFLLDGHLIVEQSARYLSGRFFNFNGTAGIWRREAIDSAGGWSHDTLTEDLDLSYRAQLAGWRFVFLPDLVVPAELPVEMNAYRIQQHRWAKGSVQTAIKILPRMMRSDQPLSRKVEAFFHLCSNFSYLFMLVPSLLVLPILPFRGEMLGGAALPIYAASFVLATLSVVAFYGVTAREAGQRIRLPWILAIMSLGIGLSLNNGRAVVEALFGHRGEFHRTPKYRVESRGDGWKGKAYSGSRDLFGLGEVALGVYFTIAIIYAIWAGYWGSIPFLVLFQAGFLYVGLTSLRLEFTPPRVVQPSQRAVASAGR